MDKTAARILRDLKKKNYAPVYLLQGEEGYYIDLLAGYLENHVLEETEKAFNQMVLYGKDIKVSDILVQARRSPVMAERQLVIVKEAQQVRDLTKEEGSKLLLNYLEAPVKSTILVLCHKQKTIDKRTVLGKKIDRLAESAIFKKLRPESRELVDFAHAYGQEKGHELEGTAALLIAEYIGNDLHRIAHELDKAFLDATKGTPISRDELMGKVGISKEYNIFELQKAIISGNTLVVARMANYFAEHAKRNPVIPMVAFLFSFFSKLLIACASPDKSPNGLVPMLKISPYAVRDYQKAMQQFTLERVIEILSLIRQTDLKIKGITVSSVHDGQFFKELLVRIAYG